MPDSKREWKYADEIFAKDRSAIEQQERRAQAAVTVVQSQQVQTPPGPEPRGIISQFRARKLEGKVARERMELWYEGQLEVIKHAVSEAVDVRKKEFTIVARKQLEALDTEFLNFANELKMENANARQDILFRLTDNTNRMLARVEDSGWHPALIKEMMDDVIQLRKRFVRDIMRGLEDE